MTQSGITNAIVNGLLGWLRGLASWVLRLFDLVGGASPLDFLANNWKKLLIILLIIGVGVDLVIWIVRWRPHWVWLRKKRVVINDKNFFARENDFDLEEERDSDRSGERRRPRRVWEDQEFVIPSAEAPRRERPKRRPVERAEDRAKPEDDGQAREKQDVFRDDLFNVNAKQKFTDKYEAEVFNVESLPGAAGADAAPVRRSDIRNRVERRDARGARRSSQPARRNAQPVRKDAQPVRRRKGH